VGRCGVLSHILCQRPFHILRQSCADLRPLHFLATEVLETEKQQHGEGSEPEQQGDPSDQGTTTLSTPATHVAQMALTAASSGVQAMPTAIAAPEPDPSPHTTAVDTRANLAQGAIAGVSASAAHILPTSTFTSEHNPDSQTTTDPEALVASTAASSVAQTPPTISSPDSEQDHFLQPFHVDRTGSQPPAVSASCAFPSRQRLTKLLDHAERGEWKVDGGFLLSKAFVCTL
jgi:hypothetical protein